MGSHMEEGLLRLGVPKENIFIPRSKDFDLRKWENCEEVVNGREVVVHVAASSGNAEFHRKNPGLVFYNNLMIGAQLMEASRLSDVQKFVSIGTAFAYPAAAPLPYKEDDLFNGPPEEVHAAYAFAKRMLVAQGSAYYKQYGLISVHLIVPNMFGPGERKESGYVIPSLIRKVVEAKKVGENFIEMWGVGEATREFLYVEDASDGIILAIEKYDKPEPVNLGSGREISIKDLTHMVLDIMQFEGEVRWDASKPESHARCLLDTTKAQKELGFRPKTDIKEGLKKTVDWYLGIL